MNRKIELKELKRLAEVYVTGMITGDKGELVQQLSTNICSLPGDGRRFLGYYRDGVVTLEQEPILSELHTKLYDFECGAKK